MTGPMTYPVQLRPLTSEEGGGWLITVPDLPGCMSDGETPEEALKNIADAIHGWIEAARLDGASVPSPSVGKAYSGRFGVRISRDLHRKLVEKAQEEGVSLNHLVAELLASGIEHSASREVC